MTTFSIGVRLLLPTVVEGLFFRALRPLSTPFGAVDDEPRLRSCSGLAPGKVIGVPLREDTQTIEEHLARRATTDGSNQVHARLTSGRRIRSMRNLYRRISLEDKTQEE